jgi:IclR family transcriptional regulator, acetate operon repressor
MTIAVKRALSLLDLFSESLPEIGLSDAARLSGHDKATVHRLMNTLGEAGLVEQNASSKRYRLGPAVLHLARLREATFPVIAVVQPMLDSLSELTGETTHCSLYANNALAVIATTESKKANRVSMRGSETLPFHATASGLVFLAFAAPDLAKRALALPRTAFTDATMTTTAQLLAAMKEARTLGYAMVERSFEGDVCGFAAPIFGPDQTAIGAIAVAAPSHRVTPELHALIAGSLLQMARDITSKLGNTPPV